MQDDVAGRGRAARTARPLLDTIQAIVAGPIPGEDVGGLIGGEKVGWE